MPIKQVNIDFQVVDSGDPKYLLIVDSTEWAHIEDKPAIIEVTMPGKKSYVTLPYDKRKVNVFNSQNLGYTCYATCVSDLIDLPDGIYKIKVKGSPDSYNRERYYLKTDITELEFAKVFTEDGIERNQVDMDFINSIYKDVELNLRAAKAYTRLDDIQSANWHFVEAQTLLENYRDCEECNQ